MADRDFPLAKRSPDGSHGFRFYSDLTCCDCGRSDSINVSSGYNPLPNNVIRKRWLAKDWFVSKRSGGDLCPECYHPRDKQAFSHAVAKEITQMLEGETPMKPTLVSSTPPEPSRGEKRAIMQLIDGVYEADKGYVPGWSDQKVATDLNVPRKWVEDIRKEFYGDNGANEEVAVFIAQTETAIKDVAKAVQDFKVISKMLEDARTTLTELSERVQRLERTSKDLRKLIP